MNKLDSDTQIEQIFRHITSLPKQITNSGSLTLAQSREANDVAILAQDFSDSCILGLREIGALMASASSSTASISKIGRLIYHLADEAVFMQTMAADYRDAADQPVTAAK